jgi:hypothetical protein
LVEVADEFIRTRLGGLRSDVLMADYRIAGLWSVRDPGHPDQGSLAERPPRPAASAIRRHRLSDWRDVSTGRAGTDDSDLVRRPSS